MILGNMENTLFVEGIILFFRCENLYLELYKRREKF